MSMRGRRGRYLQDYLELRAPPEVWFLANPRRRPPACGPASCPARPAPALFVGCVAPRAPQPGGGARNRVEGEGVKVEQQMGRTAQNAEDARQEKQSREGFRGNRVGLDHSAANFSTLNRAHAYYFLWSGAVWLGTGSSQRISGCVNHAILFRRAAFRVSCQPVPKWELGFPP